MSSLVDPQTIKSLQKKLAVSYTDIATEKMKPRAQSPLIGSRTYRAPEVILMERCYDEAVDVWAAGVCLA